MLRRLTPRLSELGKRKLSRPTPSGAFQRISIRSQPSLNLNGNLDPVFKYLAFRVNTYCTGNKNTNEEVWNDLENLSDFYDPQRDWDYPEEEEKFEDLSTDEYNRLLDRLQQEGRLPLGEQRDNNHMSLPNRSSMLSNTGEEANANNNELSTRYRIGTLSMPQSLILRIRETLSAYFPKDATCRYVL
ncbi:uncharacterized protein LOC126326209 [Schistocerca gregaria]|uniref:uncharacterized protein LOC126326209 n=1 Tax=Schistocerca gregaria TaxID=7010 RepID=UPI00211EC0CD|nr:uncharacterized protein LOC126326209 [Schistocerca gregaria]